MKVNKMNLDEVPYFVNREEVAAVKMQLLSVVDKFNKEKVSCDDATQYLRDRYSLTGLNRDETRIDIEFDVDDIAAMISFDTENQQYTLYEKCTIFKPGSMECLDNYKW